MDTPDFYDLSPAALLEPGERTGRYRVDADRLLTDDQGRGRVTLEDFAIAMLDEIEEHKHSRERLTVAHEADEQAETSTYMALVPATRGLHITRSRMRGPCG